MAKEPDFFRDFGIIPHGVSPPPDTVRCYLPWGRVVGQYIFTIIFSTLGLSIALILLRAQPLPFSLFSAVGTLAVFGLIVFLATRHDYAWVELDGETLRAQHLYTGRVVERGLDDVNDLLTLVYQVRRLETIIVEAWMGRIRGIEVRFRDKRTPLRILRADPAMKHAKELTEAIIFKMSQKGEVDAEIIDFNGTPLIRRIYWKSQS